MRCGSGNLAVMCSVHCRLSGPRGGLGCLDESFGVLGTGIVLCGSPLASVKGSINRAVGRAGDVGKVAVLGYRGRGALVGGECWAVAA